MGPWGVSHVIAAVAAVLFVVAAFASHGTIHVNDHVVGFVGLAAFAAAFLPWRARP